MSTRRIIATYAFVMFFLVIALLGTVTAAFGGTSYTEAAGRQSLYTLTAAKARGTIYDRNLQPLTNAERVYVAAVIPSRETLAKLNRAVPEENREVLRTALESGKPFLIEVTTPVSDDGIQTFSVTKRYANPQPAANLLGYLDSDYNGADGVNRSRSVYWLRRRTPRASVSRHPGSMRRSKPGCANYAPPAYQPTG